MSAAGKASGQRSLKLLCAGAVKGLVAALESRFLAACGAAIEGRFGAVGAMREALLGGAACDVLVVTAAMLAELRDQGVVAESPFAAIGEVRTGVAARSGEAVPRIDSAADLKAALVAAPALYVPDTVRSTAGRHVVAVLERLGIAAEIAPFGCTQVTEILYTPGLALAGPLPEPFGLSTVYAAGRTRGAAEPALAEAFIELLVGDSSAAERRAGGFET